MINTNPSMQNIVNRFNRLKGYADKHDFWFSISNDEETSERVLQLLEQIIDIIYGNTALEEDESVARVSVLVDRFATMIKDALEEN